MDLIGGKDGIHVLNGLWPDSTYWNTGTPNSTIGVNTGKYDHVCFVLSEGAGGTGTAVITLEACSSAAGAGATAIAFRYRLCSTQDTWGASTACASTGYTLVAGADKMVAFEVDACELTADLPYVRLTATVSDTTAVDAGVVIIASEGRYPQAVPVTAIA